MYFFNQIITQRIINSENIDIFNCLMKDFSGYSSGSAIYLTTSNSLNIINSIFINCFSNNQGGSIYKTNGIFNLTKSCFSKCRTSTSDNNFGNALYDSNSKLYLYQSTFEKCAENTNQYGDSTIFISSTSIFSSNNNFSNNFGYKSSPYILFSSITDSIINFTNFINSYALVTFESWCSVTYFLHNIINNTNTGDFLYISSGTMVFNQCLFKFNKGNSDIYGTFSFINCLSDKSLSSITISSNFNTYYIIYFFKFNCNFLNTLHSPEKFFKFNILNYLFYIIFE